MAVTRVPVAPVIATLVGVAFTIAGAGRLADQVPMRPLVMTGLALLALSLALTPWSGQSSTLWALVLVAITGRIGLGFIIASLSLGALRTLPEELVPQGASTMGFIRMLGGAVGVSLSALVLEWRVAAHGADLTQALSAGIEQAARQSAFAEAFFFLTALCLLAQGAAWRLRSGAGQT